MGRRQTIVGLGEARAERTDGDEPAGLALVVPINAVLLGHEGIAVSRLGQDRTADLLIERLQALGVDVSHLQRDPDLATARVSTRSVSSHRGIDTQAAFDNLQWDFDLSDVAQEADAVVFGVLGRQSGQARSTADRFLA